MSLVTGLAIGLTILVVGSAGLAVFVGYLSSRPEDE